jgi:hypothetical protein
MAYTIYEACVPPLTRMLGSYTGFLTKAETYLKEKGIDAASYLDERLHADMLPLKNQVFIASDMATGGAARLAQVEIPKYEDTETSFDELRARLRKTIAFMRELDAKAFVGAEDREIHLKFPTREMKFSGADYLNNFVVPNVYFHVTTGYAILRQRGVPLGKMDFLAGE